MTATNANIGIHHLASTNQNSFSPITPATSSKISSTSQLYLGSGSTDLPGITKLLYSPYGFAQSAKAMVKAEKINDSEGVLENGLKLVSTPLNFLSSLAQLARYALQGGIYFKTLSATFRHSLVPLSASISMVGLGVCFIEGILETYGLIRTAQFYSEQYPFELERLNEIFKLTDPMERRKQLLEFLEKFLRTSDLPTQVKSEIETFLEKKDYSNEEFSILSANLLEQIEKNVYLKKLQQLQKTYLQVSPEEINGIDRFVQNKFHNLSPIEQQKKKENIIHAELNTRKNDLIRRVQPWLADEISQNAPEVIQNLQSTDSIKSREAKGKAAEIFHQIKTQSQKNLLIHGIGLAAVVLTMVGLILGHIACPYLIPFVIIAVGGSLALARCYLHAGLMDSKGWEFKIENCIPAWIKALLKKQKKQKVDQPISITLNLKPMRRYSSSSNPRLNFTMTVPLGV